MNYNTLAKTGTAGYNGAPRAHQRITTATMSQASQASTVRLVRTNELQLIVLSFLAVKP